MLIWSLEGSLHVVLDLRLGFLLAMVVLKIKRGWNVVGQLSLEINLVDAWLQNASHDIKDAVFVFQEFLAVLEFFRVMLSITIMSCGVVSSKTALLASLDLELDVRSLNGLHNLNINDTLDCVSWLIERISCLKLDFALGELAPLV